MSKLSVALADAPCELQCGIKEFWPEEEWENAANIAWLESGWDPFALLDTTSPSSPCGTLLGTFGGVDIVAERSFGYFQINACNYPSWPQERFYNARHNCGTAHMLWAAMGWRPWFLSASTLGLL